MATQRPRGVGPATQGVVPKRAARRRRRPARHLLDTRRGNAVRQRRLGGGWMKLDEVVGVLEEVDAVDRHPRCTLVPEACPGAPVQVRCTSHQCAGNINMTHAAHGGCTQYRIYGVIHSIQHTRRVLYMLYGVHPVYGVCRRCAQCAVHGALFTWYTVGSGECSGVHR